MSRNIVQTNEIRRFEKSDQKQKQKKSDFQTSELRSRSKNMPLFYGYGQNESKHMKFQTQK